MNRVSLVVVALVSAMFGGCCAPSCCRLRGGSTLSSAPSHPHSAGSADDLAASLEAEPGLVARGAHSGANDATTQKPEAERKLRNAQCFSLRMDKWAEGRATYFCLFSDGFFRFQTCTNELSGAIEDMIGTWSSSGESVRLTITDIYMDHKIGDKPRSMHVGETSEEARILPITLRGRIDENGLTIPLGPPEVSDGSVPWWFRFRHGPATFPRASGRVTLWPILRNGE